MLKAAAFWNIESWFENEFQEVFVLSEKPIIHNLIHTNSSVYENNKISL